MGQNAGWIQAGVEGDTSDRRKGKAVVLRTSSGKGQRSGMLPLQCGDRDKLRLACESGEAFPPDARFVVNGNGRGWVHIMDKGNNRRRGIHSCPKFRLAFRQ